MSSSNIEEKLCKLAECGFHLKPAFTIEDLVVSWGREALDEPGFDLALICLGMTEESPPWTPHCDTLWHFDTECIEGNGSYVRIGERLSELAQGSLPLTCLRDCVDRDQDTAWIEFELKHQTIRIGLAVRDDWVDGTLFPAFASLLARIDPNKIFVYHDLDGQDCIIGCTTPPKFRILRELIPGFRPLMSFADQRERRMSQSQLK